MPHRAAGPFTRLSKRERRFALRALAAAEVVQLGGFLVLERRMRRAGGPGIIAFELAGTTEKARQMMDAWGKEGRSAARASLILDFPFPPTYALLHALACSAAAETFDERGKGALAAAGSPLGWAQLAAAIFDYAENSALLLVLSGRVDRFSAIARRAALAKLALIYAGWSYILIGALGRRRRRAAS